MTTMNFLARFDRCSCGLLDTLTAWGIDWEVVAHGLEVIEVAVSMPLEMRDKVIALASEYE